MVGEGVLLFILGMKAMLSADFFAKIPSFVVECRTSAAEKYGF